MPLRWPDADHIYLSPHADDVILSCGGSIAGQVRAGERVAVITLFSAGPADPDQLSLFAESLHRRWESSAGEKGDMNAVRRAEDRAAFAAISPSISVIHHPLPDCIYRQHPLTGAFLYASEEGLFGEVSPDDPACHDLQSVPSLPGGTILYVPLGAGHHVDHQVIRASAAHWNLPPAQTRFYEDYPYVTAPGSLEAALGNESWAEKVNPLDESLLAAKVRGVAAHRSQISTFWQGEAAMEAAIRAFAASRGGERFWVKAG